MGSPPGNSAQNQRLYHVFGIDTSIKRGIFPVNYQSSNINCHQELIYIAGRYIVKYNVETKETLYAFNNDCHRFGSFIVRDEFVYFGEIGPDSRIFVCTLSTLQVVGTLNGGSPAGYTCLHVSNDGKRLCSVGIGKSNSEKEIIVWNLEKMAIMLKAKCCGQDIVHVAFSYDSNFITSSGKGHIKFWNIAETFTGMKLQGELGKFGKFNVCNVESFTHLDNGCVLSGSDSGYLLLWKDGFLKCIYCLSNSSDIALEDGNNNTDPELSYIHSPIHKGGLNYIYYDQPSNSIITAGADGHIKWLTYEYFLMPELDTNEIPFIALQPTRSISMTRVINVINYVVPISLNKLLIQDTDGKVVTLDLINEKCEILWHHHGGKISCIDASPRETLYVSCGDDGFVYCCNYSSKKIISSLRFPIPCTQVVWCPKPIDDSERAFVVGFNDGSIQFCYASHDRIVPVGSTMRPHSTTITQLQFRNCGSILASTDVNGTVFIFKCQNIMSKNVVTPIGFIECHNAKESSIKWHAKELAITYTTRDGVNLIVDLAQTLKATGKENAVEEQVKSTYRILATSSIVQTKDSKECKSSKTPSNEYNCFCTQRIDLNGQFTIQSDTMGVAYIMYHSDKIQTIDSNVDALSLTIVPQFVFTSPSFNDFYVSKDNMPHDQIYNFDVDNDLQSKFISQSYTLEELLTKRFNEAKLTTIETKKNKVRAIVIDLRTEFMSILQLNTSLPLSSKIPQNELILNPCFHEMYESMVEREIAKATSEYHTEERKIIKSIRSKLEAIFVDTVEDKMFALSALESGHKVQSLPILKLDKNFKKLRQLVDARHSTNVECDGNEERDDTRSNTKSSNIEHALPDQEEMLETPSTVENRKAMRRRRKVEIEKKLTERPTNLSKSDNMIEDKIEEKKLEDWKVKLSDQGKHVNFKSKLMEMINCEESIFNTKKSFNNKLKSLKQEKVVLLRDMESKRNRVEEIDLHLHTNEFGYSFRSFSDHQSKIEVTTQEGNVEKYSLASLFPQIVETSPLASLEGYHLSKLEEDEIEGRRTSMIFEREKLLQDIQAMIVNFDASVYDLVKERFKIILDSKLLEFNLFTMFHELELLQHFEETGNRLKEKLKELTKEKNEIHKSINRINEILWEKKLHLESKNQESNVLLNKFNDLVAPSDRHRPCMQKIFMKAIKHDCTKGYNESGESFLDSDCNIEVLPETFPTSTYNDILELQEKRNQMINEVKLSQQQYHNVERDYDQLVSKLKEIEKNLDELKRQIEKFEDKKIKTLNEITVTVPLMTSQIYISDHDTQPASKDYIVFSNDYLLTLIERSHEIIKEIDYEKKIFNDLQADLKQKTKVNKSLEESIIDHQKRCEELQILKFGQKVDIDLLDELTETSSVTKNRSHNFEIDKASNKQEKQLNVVDAKNQELKDELRKITEESTKILNDIADMSRREMLLEKDLQAIINGKDDQSEGAEAKANDDEEILKLKRMVNTQLEEKKKLMKDINRLSRKDGYIYDELHE